MGENENSYAFKYDQLRGQKETPYPDLREASEEKRRRILYDKMACDAVIAVQTGLLRSFPLYFNILVVVPAVEALAAGRLWRRFQRPWPVIAAYAERVAPLAMGLILFFGLVWAAFKARAVYPDDWFGHFQRFLWTREVLLAALVAAQVATWRRWPWPLRLLLHAGWMGIMAYMSITGWT